MDIFQIYLTIVNIVALILYTVDYEICVHGGKGVKPEVLLPLVTILGGSIGTLVAFIIGDIRTPKLRGASHKIVQLDHEKYQSRLYAIMWIVIHVLIYLIIYGKSSIEAKQWLMAFFSGHFLLCIYYAVINTITFLVYTADKIKAYQNKHRIRETILIGMAVIGCFR